MKQKLLKYALIWQGLYYGLTGLWAIVSLKSFSQITGHHGDPFEMYSIAGLAVVLGIAFLWGAYREEQRIFAAVLALLSAIAVIIPETVFFSEIRGTLFVPDLVEEIIVAILLMAGLFWGKRNG